MRPKLPHVFRTMTVWETEDAWERFQAERLRVADQAVAHVPPTFRSLQAKHLVVGLDVSPAVGFTRARSAPCI